MKARQAWHEQRERGSVLGIRFTAWLYRRVGRGAARLLLYPIVLYFYLTGRSARAASRQYLERLHATPDGARTLGGPPTSRQVFRHFLEFASTILDRVGIWLGRREDFELTVHGMEILNEIAEQGRGGLVLGAHLGSFEAMRLVAMLRSPISVSVLMYTQKAVRINQLFRRLGMGDDVKVRVIQVEPGSFAHVMEVKAAIARGEVVTVLADRIHPSEAQRSLEVEFLGGKASLPQGPFLLGSALGCPILFMVGLRSGDRRYDIHVERLAERLEAPRAARAAALARIGQAYAERLAHYCTVAPFQWFNFYDFWLPGGVHADG